MGRDRNRRIRNFSRQVGEGIKVVIAAKRILPLGMIDADLGRHRAKST